MFMYFLEYKERCPWQKSVLRKQGRHLIYGQLSCGKGEREYLAGKNKVENVVLYSSRRHTFKYL